MPEESAGNRDTQVASKAHFTGHITFGDDHGRGLGLESNLEKKVALLLRYAPDTVDLVEQRAFEWYDSHGEYHTHYVDLVRQTRDGRRIGYAVRPVHRVSDEYQDKLARIKYQSASQGVFDDFRLFTEQDVCPIALHNATHLHAVRVAEPEADQAAAKVVGAMRGVETIGMLSEQIGMDGTGLRALVRLIASRHLQLLRHERISDASQVIKVMALH
ncbi:hypothetical protein [Qingshengfaniella alkalisoli]|uniref:hypothetical protein n=1 Tax=Qingshengfaniella alkalisoli TaxID=2599296 RepID=UPI001F106421|nr:hypothetical protein [Qingshengfaniella alkalisoli]